MLPYYSSSHHFCISQETPQPNPTGGGGGGGFFPMAPPHPEQHQLQQQHYVVDHFFHGSQYYGGQQFNSETLEAVLRPTTRVAAAPDMAGSAAPLAAPAPRNGAAGGGGARARKRPFRTDRHSKIRTAQGVRDRRMRLSLDVARDFFALQDRLGFDKASKTVDWLLTQSKPAIDRLSESSSLCNAAGVASPASAEYCGDRRLKEAAAAAAGPGTKREGGAAEKARARSGGGPLPAVLQHGYELELNHLMSSAPAIEEYYYDLGEMMSINGCDGDGDDDGDYDEDGDFLDGMQY